MRRDGNSGMRVGAFGDPMLEIRAGRGGNNGSVTRRPGGRLAGDAGVTEVANHDHVTSCVPGDVTSRSRLVMWLARVALCCWAVALERPPIPSRIGGLSSGGAPDTSAPFSVRQLQGLLHHILAGGTFLAR